MSGLPSDRIIRIFEGSELRTNYVRIQQKSPGREETCDVKYTIHAMGASGTRILISVIARLNEARVEYCNLSVTHQSVKFSEIPQKIREKLGTFAQVCFL